MNAVSGAGGYSPPGQLPHVKVDGVGGSQSYSDSKVQSGVLEPGGSMRFGYADNASGAISIDLSQLCQAQAKTSSLTVRIKKQQSGMATAVTMQKHISLTALKPLGAARFSGRLVVQFDFTKEDPDLLKAHVIMNDGSVLDLQGLDSNENQLNQGKSIQVVGDQPTIFEYKKPGSQAQQDEDYEKVDTDNIGKLSGKVSDVKVLHQKICASGLKNEPDKTVSDTTSLTKITSNVGYQHLKLDSIEVSCYSMWDYSQQHTDQGYQDKQALQDWAQQQHDKIHDYAGVRDSKDRPAFDHKYLSTLLDDIKQSRFKLLEAKQIYREQVGKKHADRVFAAIERDLQKSKLKLERELTVLAQYNKKDIQYAAGNHWADRFARMSSYTLRSFTFVMSKAIIMPHSSEISDYQKSKQSSIPAGLSLQKSFTYAVELAYDYRDQLNKLLKSDVGNFDLYQELHYNDESIDSTMDRYTKSLDRVNQQLTSVSIDDQGHLKNNGDKYGLKTKLITLSEKLKQLNHQNFNNEITNRETEQPSRLDHISTQTYMPPPTRPRLTQISNTAGTVLRAVSVLPVLMYNRLEALWHGDPNIKFSLHDKSSQKERVFGLSLADFSDDMAKALYDLDQAFKQLDNKSAEQKQQGVKGSSAVYQSSIHKIMENIKSAIEQLEMTVDGSLKPASIPVVKAQPVAS